MTWNKNTITKINLSHQTIPIPWSLSNIINFQFAKKSTRSKVCVDLLLICFVALSLGSSENTISHSTGYVGSVISKVKSGN